VEGLKVELIRPPFAIRGRRGRFARKGALAFACHVFSPK
jgi:hypothetical protein